MSVAPAQVRELVERFDHRVLPTPVVPRQQAALQRQIDATDRQTCPDEGRIEQRSSDTEVRRYRLYGLTDEEIRVVEEATRGG